MSDDTAKSTPPTTGGSIFSSIEADQVSVSSSGGAGAAHDRLEYAILEKVKSFDEILVKDMNNEMSKDERLEALRSWANEVVELVR